MEIGGKGEEDKDLGSGIEEEQGASSGVLGAQLRSGMAHNSELLAGGVVQAVFSLSLSG